MYLPNTIHLTLPQFSLSLNSYSQVLWNKFAWCFLYLQAFCLTLPGLKCVCLLCDSSNFTCQTEGACWASVMLTNGKEQVIKSCVSLPELNAQVFCHSSNNVTKTECCFTDFCNNITLHLPTGKALIFVHPNFNFTIGKLEAQ